MVENELQYEWLEQGPLPPLATARLSLLDLDFNNGCLSKGKVPRRGETPHLY